MQTLPDLIDRNLVILSIGLNPSLPAVAAGYYFAGHNNRFWRALNASGLAGRSLEPGAESCRYLLEHRRIGLTDVVKRPSRGAGDLRAADFRAWVPDLEQRIARAAPAVLWFHGKVAYGHYLKCRQQPATAIDWGLQPECQQGAQVFLSPNPSAANAVFCLDDLVAYYNDLLTLYRQVAAPG